MVSRQNSTLRKACALGLAVAALLQASATLGFCGGAQTRAASTVPRNGWRLDMIEVGSKGIGQLVIHEGYWVGEKAMYEIMSKNGYRYRMRATKAEMAAGIDVPPITQIGPIKVRLYEAFGGSGRKPGLKRPEGYRGSAGVAGWATDIPKKGGWALTK